MRRSLSSAAPIALLAVLAALLLGPTLWGDQALLPGAQLQGMAPWSGAAPERAANAPWNPLVWDAVAQFYPWRLFAARWIGRGTLPLWDPHQFCGTPFLANSQSALLYPVNWLIFLPLGLSVTRAMALVAWLQLTLAGSLTFFWLRGLGAGRPGSFTAGAAFMLSGFIITWLELPTFLSVACWIPVLFRAVHRLVHRPTVGAGLTTGVIIGLILLGGHLQIAFYTLLGAGLYGLGELIRVFWVARGAKGASHHGGMKDTEGIDVGAPLVGALSSQAAHVEGHPRGVPLRNSAVDRIAGRPIAIGALALGLMLAAPQLLPAIELSRASHRVGTPTAAGFAAYVAYAMPVGHLLTLFLPDFYGNPSRGDYWGAGNYAEYAGYVGVVSLFLALAALLQVRRQPRVLLLGLLAAFSLAMATGSPLNAIFYFGVPGFGQSGSPGRILVLFCFSAASLAGLGLDGLVGEGSGPGGRARWWVPLAALALWGMAFGAARGAAEAFVARTPVLFSQAWSRSEASCTAALALVGVAAALLVGLALLDRFRPGAGTTTLLTAARLALPALVVLDGWIFASGYNPTSPASWIYPPTAATRVLAERQAAEPGARILPINRRWSLSTHPRAVLPPNAALALGLADAQGYDSLFLGRYKGLANAIQAPEDSSPVQNGNMIFLSHLASPLLPLLGARSIVTTEPLPGRRALYTGEGVQIYDDPRALPRALVIRAADTLPTEEAELDALQRLADRGPAALQQTIILPQAASQLPSPFRGGAGGRGPETRVDQATWAPAGPNSSDVHVRLAQDAWLLVTEAYAPAWRAYVREGDRGEHESPVLRADFAFRAVRLPAGEHHVRFRYEPAAFRVGLFLAGLALMLLAAWGGMILRHRRDITEESYPQMNADGRR
jgi:hypothetical protein